MRKTKVMNKITRIFIIDDNREAIEVLRMLLESYYSVDIVGTSTDTVEAMDRVIDTEPDILFIDIELPSMSGLQFCSMIRNEVRPEMKVVFYTAHDKYLIDAILGNRVIAGLLADIDLFSTFRHQA